MILKQWQETRIGVEMLDPNNTDGTKTKAQLTMVKWHISSSLSAMVFSHIILFLISSFITLINITNTSLENYVMLNFFLFLPFCIAFLLPLSLTFCTKEFVIDKATKAFYNAYMSPFKTTLCLCVFMGLIAVPIIAFFTPAVKLLADEVVNALPQFNLSRPTLTVSFINYYFTSFLFYGIAYLYYFLLIKKAHKNNAVFIEQGKRKQRDFVFDKGLIDAI